MTLRKPIAFVIALACIALMFLWVDQVAQARVNTNAQAVIPIAINRVMPI
jgi:hypothetical protein